MDVLDGLIQMGSFLSHGLSSLSAGSGLGATSADQDPTKRKPTEALSPTTSAAAKDALMTDKPTEGVEPKKSAAAKSAKDEKEDKKEEETFGSRLLKNAGKHFEPGKEVKDMGEAIGSFMADFAKKKEKHDKKQKEKKKNKNKNNKNEDKNKKNEDKQEQNSENSEDPGQGPEALEASTAPVPKPTPESSSGFDDFGPELPSNDPFAGFNAPGASPKPTTSELLEKRLQEIDARMNELTPKMLEIGKESMESEDMGVRDSKGEEFSVLHNEFSDLMIEKSEIENDLSEAVASTDNEVSFDGDVAMNPMHAAASTAPVPKPTPDSSPDDPFAGFDAPDAAIKVDTDEIAAEISTKAAELQAEKFNDTHQSAPESGADEYVGSQDKAIQHDLIEFDDSVRETNDMSQTQDAAADPLAVEQGFTGKDPFAKMEFSEFPSSPDPVTDLQCDAAFEGFGKVSASVNELASGAGDLTAGVGDLAAGVGNLVP